MGNTILTDQYIPVETYEVYPTCKLLFLCVFALKHELLRSAFYSVIPDSFKFGHQWSDQLNCETDLSISNELEKVTSEQFNLNSLTEQWMDTCAENNGTEAVEDIQVSCVRLD